MTLSVTGKVEPISILGYFTISETLFLNIKNNFDLKYGKPETKFEEYISDWHNKGAGTVRNTGFLNYKYSNENKIILMHAQSYECKLSINEDNHYNFYDCVSFKYFTVDSYNYFQNRENEFEKTKKKIQKLKTEKTMKEM